VSWSSHSSLVCPNTTAKHKHKIYTAIQIITQHMHFEHVVDASFYTKQEQMYYGSGTVYRSDHFINRRCSSEWRPHADMIYNPVKFNSIDLKWQSLTLFLKSVTQTRTTSTRTTRWVVQGISSWSKSLLLLFSHLFPSLCNSNLWLCTQCRCCQNSVTSIKQLERLMK